MLGRASKTLFHLVARSGTLKKLASRYGMRQPSSFARRFIAGESIAEAIEAARHVEARGMKITLDLLGESVSTLDAADAATRAYLAVIDAISRSGIERNLSIKLTQLGLDVDKASTIDNLRKILEIAGPARSRILRRLSIVLALSTSSPSCVSFSEMLRSRPDSTIASITAR